MSEYLDTLASYLPTLLRRQLANNPIPLNAPRLETFPAAFLFGDITGFTPLTVRLAHKGAEGVEELSRLLNDYFDRLINIILLHGGDILKIAGDGLLVVWPAEDGLDTSIRRAAQCAVAIQAELHNYATFEGARLAMRIGLGGGLLSLAQLGGVFGRWEAIATGAPITQAGIAEGRCQPGQIILSPEAWALAQDVLQVELVEKDGKQALRLLKILQPLEPTPAPTLSLAPEAENAARAYIPGAILQRLASGQTAFLSELRRLTVIFVNLPDFERIENLQEAQTLMRTLQNALYHYEGSVNQLLMDEKGITLVAAMGLPPFAHEDDPARGVLAALEIQSGLRALGQRYAIGITTGHVYCGERGNARRREYALLGDAVNTSARLMQAVLNTGVNDIYCDLSTWQIARARLDFETLTPVKVKGRAEPVAIYRPLREKPSVLQAQAELVGRDAEKDLINDALQSLLRGRLQGPLIIEGEAGLGKSRLVEEARQQARTMGLAFYSGAGDAIERTTAYHAWRSILREGLGILPSESLEEQRAKCETALPPAWRTYAPLLDAILPLNFPETARTSILRPQARLDKTREFLDDLLLDLCSRAPTVLVLEDAHWFDTASWTTVIAASRIAQKIPVLVVLTTRPLPEPSPPEYVHLLEEPGCRPLRLSPLDVAESASLISQRLQAAHIGQSLREFIQKRAEGNPRFTEEILFALAEAGMLKHTEDGCDLKPGAAQETLGLPDTVQALIVNRLDRMKPAQQMILKVASILGRVFDIEMLRAVYPLDADSARLDQHLRILVENDLIVPLKTGNYVFKHALTREAVYNQMLFSQRRILHRAVAEWVEQHYADDLEPHYALLAHHWRHALGNPPEDFSLALKTLEYLEKAGTQAEQRLTYFESAEFFTRTLTLADQLPAELVGKIRRMRWLASLGIAQVNLGRLADACQSLERAVMLGSADVPVKGLPLYLALLREIAIQLVHRLGQARIPASSSLPEELQAQRRIVSEAQTWLFQPYTLDNQSIRSLVSTLSAVNLAETVTHPPLTLATAYAMLSFFAGIAQQDRLAGLYERLALSAPLATNEPTLHSSLDVLFILGLIGAGEWDQIQVRGERAIGVLERQGSAYRAYGNLLTQLAIADYFQAHYDRNLEKAAMVGQIGRISNDVEFQSWNYSGLAMVHMALGQFEAAQHDLGELERFLPSIPGSRLTHLVFHAYNAQLAIIKADWNKAESHAWQVRQLMEFSSIHLYSALFGLVADAEVFLSLWQHHRQTADAARLREWRTSARRACRALKQFAHIYPIARAAAYRCQGYYDLLSGHPEQARKDWLSSLDAARQIAMPHDAALAQWALAGLSGPEQVEQHQAAQEMFAELGAVAYFEMMENIRQAGSRGAGSSPLRK
jgi:class 3 adenylate cyclase